VRNAYTVSKLIDVWESDLLDVHSLAIYNDMQRCILSAIDVFSKYLHLVPLKTKSDPYITSEFRSVIHDDDSRRSVCVCTDKAKNF